MSRVGVILMAHGTPSSLDEMPEYLTLVRGGRPPSPELVLEMRENGSRPLDTTETGCGFCPTEPAYGSNMAMH